MGFYTAYKEPFLQLKTTLENVASISQVVLGEKFRVTNLPLAIINPEYTPIAQLDIGETLQLTVGCQVIVVIRETEPKDWFAEVVSVMGDVMDAVLADRSLSGTVIDTTPGEFTPGEIRFANNLYYGGLLDFDMLMHYTP